MIGELCSSGGGQRIRNSYGNIHGYHANRCHFGSNRAVSLDQYSSNNRRLSDGLPQVISDSNVFYGRHNREAAGQATAGGGRAGEDLNMNTNLHATQAPPVVQQPHSALITQQQQQQLQLQLLQQQQQQQQQSLQHQQQQLQSGDAAEKTAATVADASAAAAAAAAAAVATSNGNISPTLTQHATTVAASNGSARSSGGGTASVAAGAGGGGGGGTGGTVGSAAPQASGSSSSSSWKSRLRQFSDYFSFSFDKGNKRFGSTRSSPCTSRGNNNATLNGGGGAAAATADGGLETGVKSACCTISNSFPSPGGAQLSGGGGAGAGGGVGAAAAAGAGVAHGHGGVARHRAYSLDVPCSRHHATPRYSSGDSSSRKSSRHDDHNNSSNISNNTNNSNNTLHSSSGIIGELSGIRIRIGSAEDGSTATVRGSIGGGGSGSGGAGGAGEQQGPLLAPSISCELGLGMTSGSSSEAAPKI